MRISGRFGGNYFNIKSYLLFKAKPPGWEPGGFAYRFSELEKEMTHPAYRQFNRLRVKSIEFQLKQYKKMKKKMKDGMKKPPISIYLYFKYREVVFV